MNFFSFLLGCGASLGLIRVLTCSRKTERIRWLGAGLIVLLGALIGSRMVFVLYSFEYYRSRPVEALNVFQGGLSWWGAILGAIFFTYFLKGLFRGSFRFGLDKFSLLLLPLGTMVWVGCWQAGVAYGRVLESGTWWGMMIKDEAGAQTLRVPVQGLAVLTLLIGLGIVEFLIRPVELAGVKAGVVGLTFSLHGTLFSILRADPVQRLLSLRVDTWAAVLFVFGSALFLFIILKQQKRKEFQMDGAI
ncbi:MAG: prolipoprotein diacylglyceryl transferase [Chloroflexi bacterium]|nr:prolipoprotein diacylglyceryl transferase [Chloroflexota bacterium]